MQGVNIAALLKTGTPQNSKMFQVNPGQDGMIDQTKAHNLWLFWRHPLRRWWREITAGVHIYCSNDARISERRTAGTGATPGPAVSTRVSCPAIRQQATVAQQNMKMNF